MWGWGLRGGEVPSHSSMFPLQQTRGFWPSWSGSICRGRGFFFSLILWEKGDGGGVLNSLTFPLLLFFFFKMMCPFGSESFLERISGMFPEYMAV